jgi:hypothetical protein
MAQEELPSQDSFASRHSPSLGFDSLDRIAAGLYTLASMLVGEGEDSARLVEAAIANADIFSGSDLEQTTRRGQLELCKAAIGLLARGNPKSVAAPVGLEHASTCIGDDELDAAGVSKEELSRLIAGTELRIWLAGLPDTLRVIFVLRAVGGLSAPETASLLASFGGPTAAGWTAEMVRE